MCFVRGTSPEFSQWCAESFSKTRAMMCAAADGGVDVDVAVVVDDDGDDDDDG